MTTLLELKNGAQLPNPIYLMKPYVIYSKSNPGVVVDSGTMEDMKSAFKYYDDCEVDIRKHDLYLNDNRKVAD